MIHSQRLTRSQVAMVLSIAAMSALLTGCVAAVAQNPQVEEKLRNLHSCRSTNHVATTTIDGVGKQLTVSEQNSNYQRL